MDGVVVAKTGDRGDAPPVEVGAYVTDGERLALVLDWVPKTHEVHMEDAVTGKAMFVPTEMFCEDGWRFVVMSSMTAEEKTDG